MAPNYDWSPVWTAVGGDSKDIDAEAKNEAILHVVKQMNDEMARALAIPAEQVVNSEAKIRGKYNPADETFVFEVEKPARSDMMADGVIDLDEVDAMI